MRQSNLKKHLQRKRRSARSASGSSVDRSSWQTRLAHKYLYISVTVRNVVMKNKSEMLVRCFNWFLRPIWRSWILLAIHFDCSSIYREYRNNFDQKLQNEGEKLKHLSVHPTSQTSFFGSRVMFVESFSVRVCTVKTLLPPPPRPRWNLLLNSCSTVAKSEWTFFLVLRWIKLVSAPRQHRSAFEPELNLQENVPFFSAR